MLGTANWHVFSCLGKTLLFDVKTGGLHELDEAGYRAALRYRDNKADTPYHRESAKEERDAYKELKAMISKGLLSDPHVPDEKYTPDNETIVKALCLHVAHDCNLRCKYCFGKTGNFGMARELMSLEVAKASIDFLLEHSGPRRNLNVDFFGGEPLLNFETIKATMEYCSNKADVMGKHMDFTVTTNCVLLDDEIISFFN